MQSPKKNDVVNEMLLKNSENQKNQFELLKSPIVAEFLGFKNEDSYLENDLESAILTHIRDFLMEMGKGFAFVARQQHIVTETEDYYIDLVFYNYLLKCFVLIDLKLGDLSHQDLGQIQMYVNYYTREMMNEGDNPPSAILLRRLIFLPPHLPKFAKQAMQPLLTLITPVVSVRGALQARL